jgi:hypothetical protein
MTVCKSLHLFLTRTLLFSKFHLGTQAPSRLVPKFHLGTHSLLKFHFLPFLLCCGLLLASLPAAAVKNDLQVECETAFTMATSGQSFEAAELLFESARELPGDDPALVEQLIGPAQLLVFIAASLSDYNDWMYFLNHVVDEENYVTDRMIASGLRAGMPGQGRRFTGYHGLKTTSKEEHQAVKVGSLFVRAAPYWLPNMPQNKNEYHSAVAEMVLRYPDLSLSRQVIEMSVWRTAKEAAMSGETDVYLFKDILYAGGRKEPILAKSAGLQAIADILPSLNIKDITDEMISEFADMLDEARDPEVRYAIMSLLDRLELTPKWRALLNKTHSNGLPSPCPAVLMRHWQGSCSSTLPWKIKTTDKYRRIWRRGCLTSLSRLQQSVTSTWNRCGP